MNEVTDSKTHFPLPRWGIEWWGLLSRLVLLFSAFIGVTLIYSIILTVFRG